MIGDIEFNVEVAQNSHEFGDMNQDWKFDKLTVSEFLDRYNCTEGGQHWYLNGHVPRELAMDMTIPAFVPCLRQKKPPYYRLINMWMGYGGETSLLHNDLQDNLLHMVTGY